MESKPERTNSRTNFPQSSWTKIAEAVIWGNLRKSSHLVLVSPEERYLRSESSVKGEKQVVEATPVSPHQKCDAEA